MSYLYAIDPSLNSTGIVVFSLENYQPVYIYTIKTKPKHNKGTKLKQIAQEIYNVIKKYPPQEVVIERGFYKFNKPTQVLYNVLGIILMMFHKFEPVFYPTKTIKAAVKSGKATKEEIKTKILEQYPDIKFTSDDESDAFACGLCHLIKENKIAWEK